MKSFLEFINESKLTDYPDINEEYKKLKKLLKDYKNDITISVPKLSNKLYLQTAKRKNNKNALQLYNEGIIVFDISGKNGMTILDENVEKNIEKILKNNNYDYDVSFGSFSIYVNKSMNEKFYDRIEWNLKKQNIKLQSEVFINPTRKELLDVYEFTPDGKKVARGFVDDKANVYIFKEYFLHRLAHEKLQIKEPIYPIVIMDGHITFISEYPQQRKFDKKIDKTIENDLKQKFSWIKNIYFTPF